jgi:hypothetical protein
VFALPVICPQGTLGPNRRRKWDPFSYICVLTSIVAGLAVTRLVSGFGQLLQTRARTPPYWVHALWMVNVLLAMIITWWVQYRWRNVPHWTLFLFLWLLVAPLILYLVAALLFPTNQDDVVVTNWREHYYANNQKIFALFGLTFAIDLVDTLLKGSHLLLVLRSALLRVDVDAHRALRSRRDHKIAALSRLLRCLLSYL